ncbi:maleylpyruvate isomerase N-terminal domain-containing protein [Streptomyces sp. UNOC14_S4]|uniref:maleylpyruvate isomerase N-terminal domain-containing protein n=1 Tax=Streptomyces sp. UNOC14_S4 TaxID=2872340 RepID=UPI001E4B2B05|nr:maleylpyruvate isomerase N-terminal domain-containing protein [Streptomyces sp. UNOC14_S4]MCC3769645.1 maleylpyruvate isomerase N-terminal domain-containing protein [Streptomyces sp. UNOC14_S4]
MGSFDPVTEHARTRAALRAAVARLARLLRDIPDPDAPSGLPEWSVGDVAAHLGAVYLAYCSAFTGEFTGWADVLPPDDGPFVERITAVNAEAVRLFGDDERRRLGDFVAERGETFLRVTQGLAPDAPVAAPWYGQRTVLTLATATGLLLSESLLHGLDIARRTRLAWAIDPDEARLALGQVMPTMMPLALDVARARDVSLAYDVVIRGGPRLAVVIDGGAATVVRDAPPRAYDCRITAAPVAFLLVAFRRTPVWKPVVRGRMRAGGRRPWLAPRLTRLVASP